jgi:adsorption protein B
MPMEATLYALGLVERELLLFAAVWFVIGAADDLAWTCCGCGRLSGRARTGRLEGPADQPLRIAAVLVPAWREQDVVGADDPAQPGCMAPCGNAASTSGCYRNDPATLAAAIASTRDDRLRIVVHDRDGPTTKADCLNRLYEAMCEDERRGRFRVRSVILHDAEDMVHPAALSLLDSALDEADFVQLPVRPEPQRTSRWIGGHYCDEFAEAHGKVMVVRDWLGAGPAAGVGCAFSRTALETVAARRGASQPFAPECLTEDMNAAC